MGATEAMGSSTTVHIRLKSGFADGLHAGADGAELAVPSHCGRKALRTVVRELLSLGDGPESPDFHFLAGEAGEPLRTTLGKHLSRRGLSSEATLELTYYVPVPAPGRVPSDAPPEDAWLSSVDVCARADGPMTVLTGAFCGTAAVRRGGGAVIARGDAHTAPVKAVAWAPDGAHFLSAAQDDAARVWAFDAARGAVEAVAVFRAEDDGACTSMEAVAAARAHGAPVAAVAGFDGSLWMLPRCGVPEPDEADAARGQAGANKRKRAAEVPAKAVRMAQPTGLCVPALAFAGDELLSGGWDGVVRVWDTNTAEQRVALPAGGRAVTGVVGTESGAVVACGKDGAVRVLDRRADVAVVAACKRKGMHERAANAVAWVAEGSVAATAGADGSVRVWDLRAVDVPVHVVRHAEAEGSGVNVLDVAAGRSDGQSVLVSVGSDGRVATFTV